MQRGFTLIELSIVLVIVGLIVAGILVGRDLLIAAERRAVVAETQRTLTAFNVFFDKYRALPGDFRGATRIWGQSTICPGTDSSYTTDGTTCDGNGNGRIEYFNVPTSHEHLRAWQHLQLAGLIKAPTMTGVPASSSDLRTYNLGNSPPTPMEAVVMAVASYGYAAPGGTFWWPGVYNNQLSLESALKRSDPTLTPSGAYDLDRKIDDGKPGLGRVRVFRKASSPNCTTTDDQDTSEYATADEENADVRRCRPLILGLPQ